MHSNVYNAIEERSEIIGVSVPTTHSLHRVIGNITNTDFSVSLLVLYKEWVTNNVSSFADTNIIIQGDWVLSTNAVTNAWNHCDDDTLDTNTADHVSYSLDAAMTLETLTNNLSLPGDYFNPPLTDTTNTIFRTNWFGTIWTTEVVEASFTYKETYSTNNQYGWHAMDDILNELSYPYMGNITWDNKGETNYAKGYDKLESVWEDARTNAINSSTNIAFDGTGGGFNDALTAGVKPRNSVISGVTHVGFVSGGCSYHVALDNIYFYPVFDMNTTNLDADIDYYVWVSQPDVFYTEAQSSSADLYLEFQHESTNSPDTFFHAQGSSFTGVGSYLWGTESNIAVSGSYTGSLAVGDTNLSTHADYGSAPDGTSGSTTDPLWLQEFTGSATEDFRYTASGWSIKKLHPLVDYINSTNGLVYYAD
jgi:hypothetical protein